MPIYEYSCEECSCEFEEMRLSSTSFEGVRCPKCDSINVGRKLSTFSATIAGPPSDECAKRSCNMPTSTCGTNMCGLN